MTGTGSQLSTPYARAEGLRNAADYLAYNPEVGTVWFHLTTAPGAVILTRYGGTMVTGFEDAPRVSRLIREGAYGRLDVADLADGVMYRVEEGGDVPPYVVCADCIEDTADPQWVRSNITNTLPGPCGHGGPR